MRKPDIGAVKPDIGAVKPDIGTEKPDIGALKPDIAVISLRKSGHGRKAVSASAERSL